MSEHDERFMAMAVEQARDALGTTAPNPSVGSVIVRDGVVLGVGRTQPIGGPHAEVMSLRDAQKNGHDVRGATVYVTLEPCRHVGRTPPCTRALLEAGIARVVVGAVDPYPPMQGKGLEELRSAGVQVDLGLRGDACTDLIRGFARAVRHELPEVTLKVASSLDGRIATVSGESQWITGESARADGHRLRASHDAIVVGIGTVLADNPRLTTRMQGGTDAVPVVLDSNLRIPPGAALFGGTRRPIVICAHDAPDIALDADIIRVARSGSGIDPVLAMTALANRGLHRVLVEGGGRVSRSLIDAALVDHLVLYLGAVAIPGGIPWLGGDALDRLASAVRPTLRSIGMLGGDAVLRYGLPHRLEG